MEIVGLIVISILVGVVVGILAGLLGIGGGTLLVPVFRLGYVLAPIVSTATSLFTIIPTSISGAITHIRHKTCIPRLGVFIGIGGALTSVFGVLLANVSPEWAIIVVTACIILYSAITMFRKAHELRQTRQSTDDGGYEHAEAEASNDAAPDASVVRLDSTAHGDSPDALASGVDAGVPDALAENTVGSAHTAGTANNISLSTRQLLYGFLIGLIAGFAAGYAGVGGGFVIVPLVIQLIHVPMKLASGTSLVAVMILVIPGVIAQAVLGNVYWVAGIAVACGSIPGAIIGARLVERIPERMLRLIFGFLLIIVAIVLIVNQFISVA